jgi:hypothetical protein
MADYFASAMLAFGSQRLDGAFEAIEQMRFAIHRNFERLVIVISTTFTSSHNSSY